MQLHQLQRDHKNKTKKRVGRGGTRGKTSGRGHKGQKQHGGHGIRPEMRDVIKKIPKLRGYRFNSIQDKAVPVNLATLEALFEAGETVDPKTLEAKKAIRLKKGKRQVIKVLAKGNITKKLVISGCTVSKSAAEKIKKVGGSIVEPLDKTQGK